MPVGCRGSRPGFDGESVVQKMGLPWVPEQERGRHQEQQNVSSQKLFHLQICTATIWVWLYLWWNVCLQRWPLYDYVMCLVVVVSFLLCGSGLHRVDNTEPLKQQDKYENSKIQETQGFILVRPVCSLHPVRRWQELPLVSQTKEIKHSHLI